MFKICRVFKIRVSDIFEFVFVELEIATQIYHYGIWFFWKCVVDKALNQKAFDGLKWKLIISSFKNSLRIS